MELSPAQGGTKPAEEKKKSSLKLQCWIQGESEMLTYSDMVTDLNLNPRSVQLPAKEEETLG